MSPTYSAIPLDTAEVTPMYLAPEAITAAESVDGRADLYALGAVGYFLLTGRHVFEASSVVEMCSKHLTATPQRPSEKLGRPLATDLEACILGCLAKARDDRPANAQVLRAALLACDDAPRYDSAAARSWWLHKGEQLCVRASAAQSVEHGATMMIDLRER
jgi:serine/threonine protein kinase